jgi:hypothetical protein
VAGLQKPRALPWAILWRPVRADKDFGGLGECWVSLGPNLDLEVCGNMRVVIRVGNEGKYYSLACINEDSKGVYLVLYGDLYGMHFTYHADGKRWLRTREHETIQEFGDSTPIEKIDSILNLYSPTNVISSDALKSMGTEYQKEDPKSSVAIFLNGDILGDNLALHSYILNRDRERDFAGFLQKQDFAYVFRILACNIFALDNFPNHKIALVILGRK